MKIGVFTVLYQHLPLETALDKIAALGVEAVEISTGNYAGSAHCDVQSLLGNGDSLRRFKDAIESRGLVISGLSQHGNPLHPQEDVARATHETWRATVQLAERLEVPVVLAFSGCPGDSAGATYPNWVTFPWPDDFLEILDWQWNESVLPYWTREAKYAREHGVRIAIEMSPGFVVYNLETLLRLRNAAGPEVGVNFDPSHLMWMGADPIVAIRALGDAIYHVHAKDTRLDPTIAATNGVLETMPGEQFRQRAWNYITLGYGHGEKWWSEFCAALAIVGYDDVLSIEHEDPMMPPLEGVEKSVALLKRAAFNLPRRSN